MRFVLKISYVTMRETYLQSRLTYLLKTTGLFFAVIICLKNLVYSLNIVYQKGSSPSKESDTKILQSVYFA